ncbi:hypothetical protein [Mesorhizobium caraganae]|uniref:hypothetical protein n=1 Tax=Mesorhizobium caraganae TaxID=483206 RepID=UPI00177EDD1B|nr:hypothetical protein [Mesorhizobium caraganae]
MVSAELLVELKAGPRRRGGANAAIAIGDKLGGKGHGGADKSTLVKILNGVHPAGCYTGTIKLDGRPVSFASPADERSNGVGYTCRSPTVRPPSRRTGRTRRRPAGWSGRWQ